MLEQLKQVCETCQKCDLHTGRTHSVFGVGSEQAKIMFVGEGPGQKEDESGMPFVGRSGQLLDVYLHAIGLHRNNALNTPDDKAFTSPANTETISSTKNVTANVYIANIVKCRPPENRDPTSEERAACMPYLQEQFNFIQPEIVVCLGRIAAQELIKPNFLVTKEHGQWFEKDNFVIMGTFHPAALLRNPHNKPLAFEDFAAIRERARELGVFSR